MPAEQAGNPLLAPLGVDQAASATAAGRQHGRQGGALRHRALGAVRGHATTAASNGSVNAMHDSFTPLGGLVPMWLMQLGEVIFGGVGSGLYGMLVFAIIAVFIAGLMIGRTPEYLGKKIEAFEMKMASIAILITPLVVLVGTAIAVLARRRHAPASPTRARTASRRSCTRSPRPATTTAAPSPACPPTRPSTTRCSALAMLFGRYWLIVPVLAIAGSLAAKKRAAGHGRARCRRTGRCSSCC